MPRRTGNKNGALKRTLCGILAAVVSAGAAAKHLYTYTDEKGIVHYTDQKPPDAQDGVKSTLVRTDNQPLVRLREDGTDADRTMTFVNSAGGPVTIDIAFASSENVEAQPPLPARIVLPGMSETRAVHIGVVDAKAGARYEMRYNQMTGDFRARPDPNARSRLPFPPNDRFAIAQAFGGKASHGDRQNYYAVDIVMPEGTPVLAARDGVVMTVDNDFFGAGLDMKQYGDRANNIRIVHGDGTMAVYAHLQLESAKVTVGDRVRAGQQLALSGDTGYTNGPHLHFCVQVNADMHLVAVPFKFSTIGGGEFEPVAGSVVGGQ